MQNFGKMLVVGGRGYVGSHIVNKASMQGIKSASVSRRAPPNNDDSTQNIEFIQGNALNPLTFEEAIKEADTIGNINIHNDNST